MKTILIFCSLILSSTISLFAQQNIFSRIIYNASANQLRASDITLTKDRGFIISGLYNTGSIIIKLDSSGNLKWNKTYYRNISTQPSVSICGIVETNDSSIIIIGNTPNSLLNKGNIYCAKLNQLGDTLWTKLYRFNDTTGVDVISIQQTNDLGYILLGTTYYNSAPFSSTVVLKIDSIGNLQWMNSLEGSNSIHISGGSIKETNDNGYLIIGNNYHSTDVYNHGFLIKLTSIGALAWSKEYYIEPFNSNSYGSLIEVVNDGYICLFYKYYPTIVKLDLLGNILWSKSYQASNINKIMRTYNGYTILGGSCGGSEIIATDTIGNYLWSKYLLFDFAGATITSDKGILAIGNGPLCGVKDANDYPKIGLIKIDSLGTTQNCASQNDYIASNLSFVNAPFALTLNSGGLQSNVQINVGTTSLISDTICVDFTGGIIKENYDVNKFYFSEINNGLFTINYDIFSNQNIQFKVYDIIGKLVFEESLNSNEKRKNINCQNLQNAVYFYQIISNKIEKAGKFIIVK